MTATIRWVTFDCFGTLVDWHAGFAAILRPLVFDRTPEVMDAYHRFERAIEAERPHRLYKDVLALSLLRAAGAVGVPMSESQARTLPGRWATLPVFEDVEPTLDGLRRAGYRLGVLTNCDEDLFEQTGRSFRAPFDLVVTAERAGSYKPSPVHFRRFEEWSGVQKRDWVHVACSWFHDIKPAHDHGVSAIWLDRDRTGEDRTIATARVESAADVCAAVAEIFDR